MKKNSIDNRINSTFYPSNKPCEDTFNYCQIYDKEKNERGYYAGVFDGHGGWQHSEYVKAHFHKILQEKLISNNFKDIPKVIEETYEKLESDLLAFTKAAFNNGFPRAADVGTCALVAVIIDNKLYVANAGDSKGIILKKKVDDKEFDFVKACKAFNANRKSEQARVKEQFKDEEDILLCKGEKAWYLKSSLMVTRTIGDFRLKELEFNTQPFDREHGYRTPFKKFTGKYIISKPDIKEFDITKNDQYLVLATDGLWDEVSRKEVCELAQKSETSKEDFCQSLIDLSLEKYASKASITLDQLKKGEFCGSRRSIHDDITIIVLDLSNQI